MVVLSAAAATFVLWPRDQLPAVLELVPADYFTQVFIDRASDYRGLQSAIAIAVLLVLLLVPLLAALFWPLRGDGAWRADRRSGAVFGRAGVGGAGLVAALIAVLTLLAALPLEIWGFGRSRSFGLAVQSYGGWIVDWLMLAGMLALALAVLGLVAIALIRRFGRAWWPLFGAIVVAIAGAFTMLSPVVIAPLFADFERLPPGAVRDDVKELSRQAGVRVGEVYVVDAASRTTAANAYVAGLGATKRVVLYDTLIDDFSREERRQVIAHEFAHAHYDDLLTGLIWFSFVAFCSMFAVDLLARQLASRRGVEMTSAAGAAMLIAATVVAIAISQPFANALSRKVEARADAYALQITGRPDSAIALEQSLTVQNLSRPDPPRWLNALFGTHPTPMRRIGMAKSVELESARPRPAKPRR